MANDSERLIAKRTAEARDFKQKLLAEKKVNSGLQRQLDQRTMEHSSLLQEKSALDLEVEKSREQMAKLKADLSAALKVADEATTRADNLARVEHQKIKDEGIAEYQQKVLMGLMTKAREDSFGKGYLLGIQHCKRQLLRDFPEAKLDLSDWVVKSDDEEEEGDEGEEEEGGDGGDVEILEGEPSSLGEGGGNGGGGEPMAEIDGGAVDHE